MGELSTVAAAERVGPSQARRIRPERHECPSCGYSWTLAPDLPKAGDPDRLAPIWAEVLGYCAERVTDFILHVWLAPLELLEVTEVAEAGSGERGELRVTLGAPDHVRGWVRERYAELLRDAFAEVVGAPVTALGFVAQGQPSGQKAPEAERPQRSQPPRPEARQGVGPEPEKAAQPVIKRRRSDI
jgi:hypothetical protein